MEQRKEELFVYCSLAFVISMVLTFLVAASIFVNQDVKNNKTFLCKGYCLAKTQPYLCMNDQCWCIKNNHEAELTPLELDKY